MNRFWSKVDVRGPDDCWEWTASVYKDGYGQFGTGNKKVRAHRLSWEIRNGLAGSLQVLHSCDNRKCVNPKHLFLGTNLDNIADKVSKGRQSRAGNGGLSGSSNPMCKLTEERANEIRTSSKPGVVLAKEYNISTAQVSRIRTRKRRSIEINQSKELS